MRGIVIVGAGRLGREVLDAALAAAEAGLGAPVLGVVADEPHPSDVVRIDARGVAMLGSPERLVDRSLDADHVIAVEDAVDRVRMHLRLAASGSRARSVTHPSATIGGSVVLADGVVIGAGARICGDVRIGAHAVIGAGSVVGVDARIGSFATVGAGAVVSAGARVGDAAVVDDGVAVRRDATVGDRATAHAPIHLLEPEREHAA